MFASDGDILRRELVRLRGLMECAGYAVSVANREGAIILQAGEGVSDLLCRSDRLGSVWMEEQSGTNGIGTCLADARPAAIFHDEHFFPDFFEHACVAVPFFGSDDTLSGVLNLSTENPRLDKATHALALRIALEASSRIDGKLFRAQHPRDYVLRLTDGETAMLLAVDEDGCLVGADRWARKILSLPESALGSRSIWGVFERTTRIGSVFDLSRGQVELRPLTSPRSMVAECFPPREACSITAGFERPKKVAATGSGKAQAKPLDRCAGSDKEMHRQVRVLRRMLGAGLPILVLGETGVGKDTLARAVHEESTRSSGPFVALNCAAVQETLIDSELFGYGGGAFTGAKKEGSPGRLVEANGGTLFLDEIGDMPLAQQTRLLRVLESGEVMPIGGGKTRNVDLQIVAATHQDISTRVANGLFRQDLYYRLAGAVIRLPALRERDDVEDIFQAMIVACAEGTAPVATEDALKIVRSYPWPGNIREMKYVTQRAIRLCVGHVIRPDDLMLEQIPSRWEAAPTAASARETPLLARAPLTTAKAAVFSAERDAMIEALSQSSDGVEDCAQRLGMSRATFYRKLKMHGLNAP